DVPQAKQIEKLSAWLADMAKVLTETETETDTAPRARTRKRKDDDGEATGTEAKAKDDGDDHDPYDHDAYVAENKATAKKGKAKKAKRWTETLTLANAVGEAWSRIQSLGEDLMEAFENVPENLQQTEANQTKYETASTIETFMKPEVPA